MSPGTYSTSPTDGAGAVEVEDAHGVAAGESLFRDDGAEVAAPR